ncbi:MULTISPECIES: MEDS domain-containing protein [unclassified Rossellomorea]|uniref:MEDS domain-containing protein n=1 Tax=unclassified Rossellomorea TaxID=2837526 RepID=UPI0020C70C35|nr:MULTISPECIES: MEDS domain-containing protein [unclassified Rossellomorea]UTE77041.1 MEDS domain-containing protein [Rossellomorea sp. KS-H15a]WGG44957.1 MEDS domain-containing protein [Rossellomorea sp. DA94]
MREKISELLEANECSHVLYAYQDREKYLKNTFTYILEGIESGEHVLLIENERNMNVFSKELKNRLTSDQLKKVHAVSNFDFYQSSGSYHPPAIYEQLMKTITPFIEKGINVRSWTNVEWGALEDPCSIVDWFENETDRVVHELKLTVVCAYDSEKMPEQLAESLKKNHGHLMTDHDILSSVVYSN